MEDFVDEPEVDDVASSVDEEIEDPDVDPDVDGADDADGAVGDEGLIKGLIKWRDVREALVG